MSETRLELTSSIAFVTAMASHLSGCISELSTEKKVTMHINVCKSLRRHSPVGAFLRETKMVSAKVA